MVIIEGSKINFIDDEQAIVLGFNNVGGCCESWGYMFLP